MWVAVHFSCALLWLRLFATLRAHISFILFMSSLHFVYIFKYLLYIYNRYIYPFDTLGLLDSIVILTNFTCGCPFAIFGVLRFSAMLAIITVACIVDDVVVAAPFTRDSPLHY